MVTKKIGGARPWNFFFSLRNTEQHRFSRNPNWRTVDLIGIHLADKGRCRVVDWLRRSLRGCEHRVELPNTQGWITSKGKPWELAGQIAAGKERERETEEGTEGWRGLRQVNI